MHVSIYNDLVRIPSYVENLDEKFNTTVSIGKVLVSSKEHRTKTRLGTDFDSFFRMTGIKRY